MRNYILAMVFSCLTGYCFGQNINVDSLQLTRMKLYQTDSLEQLLSAMPADTARANYLGFISYRFAFYASDKSITYGQEGIRLSRQLGYKKGIAYCSQSLAMGYWLIGKYSYAQEMAFNALRIYEELEDKEGIAFTYYVLSVVYRDFGDYKRALAEAQKGYLIYKKLGSSDFIGNGNIGSIYELQNKLDSADYYVGIAIDLNKKISQDEWGWLYYLKGNIYRKRKQYDSALLYYRTALLKVDDKDIVETYNGIALLYQETGRIDSSNFYANEVLQKWSYVAYQRGILQAASILAANYKKLHQQDSTIKYLEKAFALNDSIYGQQSEREIQNMAFNEQMRQEEMNRDREEYRTLVKIYALIAAGLVFLFITIMLWRNNQQKQKAKEKIEQAYADLKSTQQQLIQSEKMASLGELTAGIAHEIQNPLNFVNNFSEVNTELLDELKMEILNGKIDSAVELSKDIRENEEKINQHGKKADAIVKSMLQHSRSSSGIKEPTNINALAEDYLQLAYHGFRAKDKSFNVSLNTAFDQTIGEINIVPQDIGRVLLNLFSNAFYAVSDKQRQGIENYEPLVTLTTKRHADKIEVSIKDNGRGIPEKIRSKIFQPFFTTKPTGQGTGLGLSLSYDIIKAHGGELKVETTEGQGSEFIIQLPI